MIIGSEVIKGFFANNGPSPYDKLRNVGTPVTSGSWGAYEMYIKFSSTPGKGIYRTWQNGKLIFEDTTTATLRSSSSISDFVYLWSYWNDGAPRDQSAYIDDVIVTNENPGNKDAQGNPYIGVGGATFLSPPKPPSFP